jgi:hypothetical protein
MYIAANEVKYITYKRISSEVVAVAHTRSHRKSKV